MKILGENQNFPIRPVKDKKLVLGKGNFFGEEECLKMIINNGDDDGPKPIDSFYTITSNSNDCEVMWAYIDDVYKLIKNERKLIRFMNFEYIRKYPNKKLTDHYLEDVFKGKFVPDPTSSRESSNERSIE